MAFIVYALDVFSFLLSFVCSAAWVSLAGLALQTEILLLQVLAPLLIITLITFAINNLFKYHGLVSIDEFKGIVISLFNAHLVLATSLLFSGARLRYSVVLVANFLLSILFVSAARFYVKNRLSKSEKWKIPVVLVGKWDEIGEIARLLKRSPRLFIRPVHILTLEQVQEENLEGVPVSSYHPDACQQLAEAGHTLALVFASGEAGAMGVQSKLEELNAHFDEVYMITGRIMLGALSSRLVNLAGYQSIHVHNALARPANRVVKRFFDLAGSLLFFSLFWPVYLLMALLVWLDAGKPIIYTQLRVGKGGKLFPIYKFRTMKNPDGRSLEEMLAGDPAALSEYQKYRKLKNDPRITRLGRFFRRYSLDELPQIWNILKGDMSLLGPRPYTPDEIDPQSVNGKRILSVLPGVSGWWQVMGRNETTFEERQELDKYYVNNWSLWMEGYILLKSVWVVLGGTGR